MLRLREVSHSRRIARIRKIIVLILISLLLPGALTVGCGGDSSDSGSRKEHVVAAFYPLAWAAERIAPAGTRVRNLTPPGAEPHDVELSPRDVEQIVNAQVVLYAGGGFQPAVEDAVAERNGTSLDVVGGDRDPHVWLDPVRFADVVREIGRALDRPEEAEPLAQRLGRLHESYARGLGDCERRTLVTTHAAFGHLAARYGLTQVSLAGSSPEAEPTPRELEQLIDEVDASHATTVFSEPLVSDRVAETVARATGTHVAVLDPLEGLAQERLEAGEDYLSVMRGNLRTLLEALGCR